MISNRTLIQTATQSGGTSQPQIPLIRIRRKIKNVNQLGCRKKIGTYGKKILRATGDYMLVDMWPDN